MTHRYASLRTQVRLIGLDRQVRERGSFAVIGALWLVIALVVLGSIDIGHLYFERRDLQRIADTSAMAAVQTMDNTCASAPTTASNVAAGNDVGITLSASSPSAASLPQPSGAGHDLIAVQCGRWDAPSVTTPAPASSVAVSGASPYFYPYSSGSFSGTYPLNAVLVQVTRVVPYFFMGPKRTLSAMATARATNIDTFGVSGTLASVGGQTGTTATSPCASSPSSSSLTNALLVALLGQGSGINASLISSQGLACSNIQLGDLVNAAVSAGYISSKTVSGLLSAQLTVAQIAKIAATALTNTSVANVSANANAASSSLGALQTAAGVNLTTPINIGSSAGTNPLLQLGITNTQAALTSQINLLDLMTTSLEVAQAGKSAVSVNATLPLLSGDTISQLQVQVINPPTIVTGEPGYLPNGTPRTEASQGEIGIFLNLSIGTLNVYSQLLNALGLGALLNLLSNLLGGTSISLNLPIYLEVGSATAWLDSIQCAATKAASTITIKAQPSVVNLCIGEPPGVNATTGAGQMDLTSTFTCSTPATLANVNLGSSDIVNVKLSPISAQVSPSGSQTLTFSGAPNPLYASVNSNALGSALANAVAGLTTASVTASVAGIGISVGTGVLAILNPLFASLGTTLDSVLVPLLNTLGIQVGEATVEQISLTCGVPQIVY